MGNISIKHRNKMFLLQKKVPIKIKSKKIHKIYERYLDFLWGLIIHERDKHCQYCGKSNGKLDAHHIYVRQNKSTRWDTANGILLCYYCHNWRLHKDPESMRQCFIKKLGSEKLYLQLYKKSKEILTFIPYEQWEEILIKELSLLQVSVPKKPKALQGKLIKEI